MVCPHCGRENPAGARFCNSCGAVLADPDAAREVRKTVTVLFCDVVGSTELASRSDPEVMRGVMARFYATIREPVERYGGTVEKVIGDALVAVFGIPVVHEDDALRAVRAALEMRNAVRELGEIQAGIGKSRLASEVRRLGADVTVLQGQCRATTSSSLQPLLEIAGGVAPVGRDLAETIVEAMHGDRDAAAIAASLAPGGARGAPDIAWAASRLIGTLAAAGTVAIVLEDVHWADDLLLDVVEQLLGRSRGRALLVVCTARPEFAEARPTW